jgi:hypothetical protein
MDDIFSEAATNVQFSDLIGFRPLPVTKSQLGKPASNLLTAKKELATGIVRLKANSIMVAALSGPMPNLSSSLKDVAATLNIRLLY